MPENPTGPTAASSGAVTKTQLKALSANFFSRLQILENGNYRPIDCSDPGDPKKNDTRSVYFDKKSIDDLFAENPGSNGLKIFFGIHDDAIFPLPGGAKDIYQNKLMVVLVTTTDEVENLNDDSAARTLEGGGGGEGLDNGKLCPPLTGC